MSEEIKKVGLTSKDKAVHIEFARSLFFFERANAPEDLPPDGRWPEARELYLKRSRRLMQALRKAGLVVARLPGGEGEEEPFA